MLFKLSLKNIKKSIKDYSIYFFTLVVAVAIFYVFNSMDAQDSMLRVSESKHHMVKTLIMLLSYVSVFVSIILGFLIVYSNNFLIKRRKKEIGLYLTLGMSKRKVSSILVIETLIVGICSLVVGLLSGIGLSQVLSTFTAKLFEADMSKFQFVFSLAATIKTIIYFGIIFILVMIFNILSLSRFKLIDLLNANKKNEKIKIRNKYLIVISFILTFVLLWYAYYLLFNDALLNFDEVEMITMIACGSIGTFLLFFSLSSVMLNIFQRRKKTYYKGLNMFVLKQINSKVNTSVISTTVISLMLLLTIGILSGSMSLTSAFNGGLKENNESDFTIFGKYSIYYEDHTDNFDVDLDKLVTTPGFDKYVKNYTTYTKYESDTITIGDLISADMRKELYKEYGQNVEVSGNIPIMLESEYKSLMELYGKKPIDVKDDEYLILVNVDQVIKYYSKTIKNGKILKLGDVNLKSATNDIVKQAVINYNSNGNDGILVVSDIYKDSLKKNETILIGNYVKTNDVDKLENELYELLINNGLQRGLFYSKLEMEASSVGIKAILTFLGMYLGIIFAISSATVLAIGQLSESSDNKERYEVLRKIGADEKMVKKALMVQIAVAFLLPLGVALFHAFFGLRELNKIIQLLAHIDLMTNILITALFITIVYGGYFLATYLCSKNIIKED